MGQLIIQKKYRKGVLIYYNDNKIRDALPLKLNKVLYNTLAYKKEGWQFMPNPRWIYDRLYNFKYNTFPWGLKNKVLSIVEQWCKYSSDTYEIIDDTFLKIKDIDYTNLRPYQVDALNALLENKGGILSIPTGAGKTLVGIHFLKSIIYKKVLIAAPTKDLVRQWQKDCKDLLSVDIFTYQYLNKHKNILSNYDVFIADEVHHISAKCLYSIAINCANAIMVGLSATPTRAYRDEEIKIFAAIGEIVYRIDIQQLVELKYLTPAQVIIKQSVDDNIIDELWDEYQDIYRKYVTDNIDKNNKIIEIARNSKKPCLILCDKIKHGEILFEIAKDLNSVWVHGKSNKRKEIFDDIKNNKYDIIIATQIFNEGVNFPEINSLILASGGKSSIKIIQQIGRILRIFEGKDIATIYDFSIDVKYLKEHFKARLKVYNEHNIKVIYDG